MISIIVPVYNVEKYLSRCLDSIINQTYKDYEVILSDDGSTDSSGKICDEYAAKYSNIHVIHADNAGLSVARNRGIHLSKGEFITYVDSDDLISIDYLEKLYNLIQKFNADISCCECNHFYNDSEVLFSDDFGDEQVFDGYEGATLILYGMKHGTSAWGLLIKRSIAEKNIFTAGKYHEDDLVTFKFFLEAKKVVFTSKPMYWYFQRNGSIMRSSYGQIAIDELDAADYIFDTCSNYDVSLRNASSVKKYFNYRDVLLRYPEIKTIDSDTYKRIKYGLKSSAKIILMDKNYPNKLKAAPLILVIFGINIMLFFNQKLGI